MQGSCFKADDANLDKVYIETNKGKIFKATPYAKEGYYAARLLGIQEIKGISCIVIAFTDKAGAIFQRTV